MGSTNDRGTRLIAIAGAGRGGGAHAAVLCYVVLVFSAQELGQLLMLSRELTQEIDKVEQDRGREGMRGWVSEKTEWEKSWNQ